MQPMPLQGPIALLFLILWVASLFVFFRMGADIRRLREFAERQAAADEGPKERPKDPVAEEWAKEQERKRVRAKTAAEEAANQNAAEQRLAEIQARKTGEQSRHEA